MKRSLIALAIVMTATLAAGDTSPAPPDYSRDTILKILHESDRVNAPFRMRVGMMEGRTKYLNYHFAYLPLLASIPYAGPYGARFLPNPFVLTHTEYAWRPHQFVAGPMDYERSREEEREFRRIVKMLKRSKVVVTSK